MIRPLIDELLSHWDRAGHAVYQNAMARVYGAFFPATVTVGLTLQPPATSTPAAYLLYSISFGVTAPDIFSFSLLHGGLPFIDGEITEDWLQNGIDCLALVRNGIPLQLAVTNNDPTVTHQFEALYSFLIINSTDDFDDLRRIFTERLDGGRGNGELANLIKQLGALVKGKAN